ncbi:hypothetical protein ABK040_007679 [Willaertia magna]
MASNDLEVKEKILLNFLTTDLGFSSSETKYHSKSDTVEEWKKAVLPLYENKDVILCKNFFLHHKRKKNIKFYAVAFENANVDLNTLSKSLQVGSGNLRFADNEELPNYLDVMPGSVTPLAFHILNEKVIEKRKEVGLPISETLLTNMKSMTIIVDYDILRKDTNNTLLFHPLHSCASTSITQREFEQFLRSSFGEEAFKQIIVYDFKEHKRVTDLL